MVLTAYLLLIFFWTVWTRMPVNHVRGKAVKFVPSCDQDMFESNVDNCLSDFNKSLEISDYRNKCPWPAVKSVYNELKHCVDDCAKATWCGGHRFLIDKVFLKVHETYFFFCGRVHDPPVTTLVMLIAPVIIATLLLPVLCINLATYNTEKASSLGL